MSVEDEESKSFLTIHYGGWSGVFGRTKTCSVRFMRAVVRAAWGLNLAQIVSCVLLWVCGDKKMEALSLCAVGRWRLSFSFEHRHER